MGIRRFPVLSLVALILAVLLVVTEGACLGATIFRGYPLATCLGHNGSLVIMLAVLFAPLTALLDCLWSRVHRGTWPWDVADSNGSAA